MNAIDVLPSRLQDKRIGLCLDDTSLWPLISKLKKLERNVLVEWFEYPSNFGHTLADKESYVFWYVEKFRRLQKKNASRVYWIHSKDDERLVGVLIVEKPKTCCEALTVGYFVLPEHRGRGFAADATKLMAAYLFEKELTPNLCAYTAPDNTHSIRTLFRAGFRDMGIGKALPEYGGKDMQRFMRSLTNTWAWPLAPA